MITAGAIGSSGGVRSSPGHSGVMPGHSVEMIGLVEGESATGQSWGDSAGSARVVSAQCVTRGRLEASRRLIPQSEQPEWGESVRVEQPPPDPQPPPEPQWSWP
jgi:hypothetical protein